MPNREQKGPRSTGISDTGNTVTEQVQQQTQQVTQQAQQKAGQVTQQAQQQATSLARIQKSKASQSLNQVSQALQQTGQELKQQGQSMPAQGLTTAGKQVERLAGYLDSHDVQEIVGEVESFGRRQPAVFLGGAFTIGLVLSRLLKSSPPTSETTGSGGGASNEPGYIPRSVVL